MDMSEIEPKNTSPDISLEDLDSLLDQEDPSFNADLKAVAQIKPESEIDTESSVDLPDEAGAEDDFTNSQDLGRWHQVKLRVQNSLSFQWQRLKQISLRAMTQSLYFLKTKPIEFVKYFLSQFKALFGALGLLLRRFSNLSKTQKLIIFILILLSVGVVFLTMKNLKGTWIPSLNPPLVISLSQVADATFPYSGGGSEMFYRAFPRDPDIFLFKKFKVNLLPSEDHANPMGAFEVVIEVDSKEAAIEAQDREVELHDLIQREFETQSYPSLLTDLGKQQLKNKIKKAVDDRLSQGWIEAVHFQTFILKP